MLRIRGLGIDEIGSKANGSNSDYALVYMLDSQ